MRPTDQARQFGEGGALDLGGETGRPTRFAARRPGSPNGFTLVELMVTLAVLAVLLTLAAPSFMNVTLGSKLNAFANGLVASAHLARSEAIKRNAVVTLCVSSDGTTCGSGDWAQGWIVVAAGTVFQRQEALPAGFKVNSDQDSIAFQPTGVGATQATLTVCRAIPSPGTQEREVNIALTGRPSVETKTAGSCP